MNLIKNNPYRILGLLVGASAAQLNKHRTWIPQYIIAEAEIPIEFTAYSFEVFGTIHRTTENIEEAASKLDLDSDKINAALFWFWNGHPITDEAAFEAMKEGNFEYAIEIWSRRVQARSVTKGNASAHHNLSTLYFSGALKDMFEEDEMFEIALSLKIEFLESDFIKEFTDQITDEHFKITKKELQLLFLENLSQDVGFNISKFFEAVSNIEFSAKQDFMKGLVQKPISQIEQQIETAKSKRKANKANAINAGKELYNNVAKEINQLKSILGTSDIKFSSISDKVAEELLQCGIDYFKHYRDSNTDPSSYSMDLFRKAKTFAIGSVAKQRIQENTENLQEWINDKPERDKQKRIAVDFEQLKNLIDRYESLPETVANAKQLLSSAKPYLNNVKNALGSTDELYLGLSSRIGSDAQGMCVSEINKLQERFANTYDPSTKVAVIFTLKQKVDEAWEVTNTISAMDLRSDFRSRVNQNKNSLSGLRSQLSQVTTGSGRSSSSSSSGGCYIATMAYGSYEHPQVFELRKFRDDFLAKTIAGRMFIQTYYFISPKLVELLKNQKSVNTLIRKALNQFIKVIKK